MNSMSIQKIKNLKLVAVLLSCIFLTACGGGGGGGEEFVPPPGSPPPVGPSVTGIVTKGPINGATVRFFNINSRGVAIGDALASATTDSAGSFSVTLPAGTGTVLVESSGGSFIDESDQEPNIELKRQIQFFDGQGFASILPAGATIVAINPYTHALVERARFLSEPAGGFQGLFDTAKAILDAQAGFDVLTTIPANPIAPDASASVAQKQYALLLGGMANAINKVSIQLGQAEPSYDVIIAVAIDFVDGTLDGRAFGEPVVVSQTGVSQAGTGTSPGNVLPANVILDTEITRFRNNNAAAYVGINLPSIETNLLANIDTPTLVDTLPNSFLLVDRNDFGDGVGEDFDSGTRFTLNGDGTVTILTEFGTLIAPFTITGDVLRIDFPAGILQDDFESFFDVDSDGVQEQFRVEEVLLFLELTLVEDLINVDVLNVRAVGFTQFSGVNTSLTKADEPFDETEPALAFDYARQIPFNITDGYRRTLLFNSSPQFPELFFGSEELYIEEFVFNVDGTGLTLNNNIAFTWLVNADGHLSVVFANGESAEYFHLATRPSGDIVSVEYTSNIPLDTDSGDLTTGDARLSFLRDNTDPLPANLSDVAGI